MFDEMLQEVNFFQLGMTVVAEVLEKRFHKIVIINKLQFVLCLEKE